MGTNFKTKTIYLDNHVDSRQNEEAVAMEVMKSCLQFPVGQSGTEFFLIVDDGDGDVWKYRITVESEGEILDNSFNQLKQN